MRGVKTISVVLELSGTSVVVENSCLGGSVEIEIGALDVLLIENGTDALPTLTAGLRLSPGGRRLALAAGLSPGGIAILLGSASLFAATCAEEV